MAVLAGGASFIAGDNRIKLDPNDPGETATFTFESVIGTQYVISITGQSNQSESFVQAFIDRDGPGTLGFEPLGGNINFDSGFNTNVASLYGPRHLGFLKAHQWRHRQR
jgi:hypothetical protein